MFKEFEGKINGIVKATADKELLHNNANKASERIPVMRDMVAGEVSKELGLESLLPKNVADAHKDGCLHFHDLDYSPLFPMFNCMLIGLTGMLRDGFKMGNAEIETPKSISTATAVTAQIIAQVASHIYGGNTINGIDTILAPYVRKSYSKHHRTGRLWFKKKNENGEDVIDEAKASVFATKQVEKETYDAFQSLEYEINTLHTANGQTPFTTFGFGLGTSWEERLIQESVLKVRIAGLGKNKKTAIFPKLVFTIRDGVNLKKDDVNYDIKQLALECATKRMYPDIINYDRLVEVTGGHKYPMGCRSFLSTIEGMSDEGRNNLGVVSVNLPRLGLLAQGNELTFWDCLCDVLDIAKIGLMSRIEVFKDIKAEVAPILYTEGACGVRLQPQDSVMDIFKNGRASISLGYIGLHELANAMFPNEPHTFESKVKQDFLEEVMKFLNRTVHEWTEDTGYGFSLYSTPSESLCDRFCRLDAKSFGEVEGVTTKGYYTNSFHLDVNKKVNPRDKIDFESKYPTWASGGFISYVEFPNMVNNVSGLERVWDYTYDKLPYFGTNAPIDYCGVCNFSGEAKGTEDGFCCPSCGNDSPVTLSVTRRVCGYLGSPDSRPFNPGKQLEVISRVKHS